jgi:O-antigen ligase
VYRAYVTHRAVWRTYAVLVAVALVAAVVLTFTRGALLSIPLSVLLLAIIVPSRRLRIALFSGVAGLGALAFVLATVVRVPLLARFFNEDVGSLNGRTYLWQALLRNIDPLHVFGEGLGAGDALLTRVQIGIGGQAGRGLIANSASNLFVGTIYDSGIIGVVLLIITFCLLAVSLVRGIRRTRGERQVLFVVATMALCNALVQSLDVSDLWDQAIGVYFWIIMALPFAACWFGSPLAADRSAAALAPPCEIGERRELKASHGGTAADT